MTKYIGVYTSFLLVFILMNVFIYFLIQLRGREKIFKKLFHYWLSVFFVLIFEGMITDGKLALSLIFLVNFIPIALMSNFLLSMYDYKFQKRFYTVAIPSAILLTLIFNQMNAPFFLVSLPVVLINTGPLWEGLYLSLVVHRREKRTVEKTIACTIYGAGILSCLYYGVARYNASELEFVIGFGSAFISYLMCSMLLPILCIQIINRKRTDFLESMVIDRTRELSESKCEKEKLLRVLVHDISNPLQAAMLQVAKARRTTTIEYEFFNKIEKNHRAIKDIIAHIREFEKVLSETKSFDLKEVLLVECLNEIEDIFIDRFKIKEMNLKIHNKLHPDTKIKVDKTSFVHSVTSNLVSNALKFSRPGSEVLIVAFEKENQIVIEVVDQGIGMSKENLSSLFDIGASTSREGTIGEKGAGFGMPIVKAYTTMFGGRVEASSTQKGKDTGTTISIFLPNLVFQNNADAQTYLQ